MFKAIISLIIVILLIIFASQNMGQVSVHVVMGRPVEVPMILIIAVSFILGYATALFTFVIKASSRNKQNRDVELPEQYPR